MDPTSRLLARDVPFVLVLDRAEQWADVVTALLRVGYDLIAGYLHGGFAGWLGAGLPIEHVQQWTVDHLRG